MTSGLGLGLVTSGLGLVTSGLVNIPDLVLYENVSLLTSNTFLLCNFMFVPTIKSRARFVRKTGLDFDD